MFAGLIGSGLLVFVVAFPWHDIVWHSHWSRVAWIPFASGPVPYRTADVVANLLLFVPVGVMAGLACRRGVRVAGALTLMLSLVVEAAQLYSHSRFPSATDVVCNVAGAVAAATVARRYRHRVTVGGSS